MYPLIRTLPLNINPLPHTNTHNPTIYPFKQFPALTGLSNPNHSLAKSTTTELSFSTLPPTNFVKLHLLYGPRHSYLYHRLLVNTSANSIKKPLSKATFLTHTELETPKPDTPFNQKELSKYQR